MAAQAARAHGSWPTRPDSPLLEVGKNETLYV